MFINYLSCARNSAGHCRNYMAWKKILWYPLKQRPARALCSTNIINWARGQETRWTFGYLWHILKIWKSYKRHQNLGFVQNESYSCHPWRTTDWSRKITGGQLIFQKAAWNLNLVPLIILCSPKSLCGNILAACWQRTSHYWTLWGAALRDLSWI